jgi:PilZ domain-containing protein
MQSVPTPTSSARSIKRRSARVQLKIQIVLELSDSTVLDAETSTVSKHGARIRVTSTRGHLAHGQRVIVRMRRGRQSQAARVVWVDKRSESHYGIELEQGGNFWGVHFPISDGEGRFKRKELRRPVAHAAAASDLAVPEKAAVAEISRTSALIAGISAGRMPFAERVDMIFHHPEEGTALLQTVVEPGATLRLTFADRVAQGRVMTVAGQREAGKWRVHIKCDAAHA